MAEYQYQHQHQHHSRDTLNSSNNDCYVAVIFVMALAIIGLAVSLAVATNTNPNFDLPEFHIDSVAVSPFDPLDYQTIADLNWNITFGVKNPMGVTSISYDMVHVSLFQENKFLFGTNIEDFYQSAGNQTTVHAAFFAPSATHIHCWVCKAMDVFMTGGKVVEFNFKLQAMVTLHPRGQELWMTATCYVPFLSNTVAGTLPKKCNVRLENLPSF